MRGILWTGLMVGFGTVFVLFSGLESQRELAQVSGRITDLSGELPLPGVSVTLRRFLRHPDLDTSPTESSGSEIAYQTETDQHGGFVFPSVLPRSRYSLLASSPGWKSVLVGDIYPNDAAHLVFDLGLSLAQISPSEGFLITGRIVKESGDVLPDASVSLFCALNSQISYQTRSGTDGGFAVRVHERAIFVIFALKPGVGSAVGMVRILPDKPADPLVIQVGVKE